MHAFLLKLLRRTPVDIRTKLFTRRTAIPFSEQISAVQHHHQLYTTMSSAHAKQQPETDQDDARHNGYIEDMVEAFGEAYATRATEEGYGKRYEESVNVFRSRKDKKEIQRGATAETDPASVGPPEVREKEDGRHSTQETA